MEEASKSVAAEIVNGNYTLSGQRKGRSLVWNILAEIIKPDNSILSNFVYCRTCGKVLRYCSNQTSNLMRHICCKAIRHGTSLQRVSKLDKTKALEKCTAWITEDCSPFSAVRGSGFMKLVKFLIKIGSTYGENVDVEDLLPEPKAILQKVKKCANEEKQQLKDEMNNIVSIGGASATIYMWRDNYVKRNFIGVTLHYQKDFKFIDVVLGMKSMSFERSTSDNILKKIRSVFKEFSVENIDQIKFITNNEPNIVKALESNTRLNCSVHLFSNVLANSFAETTDIVDVLESCKKVVKYLKKENLHHLLPTSLNSQSPSRWNSHYAMLKCIVDNWDEINNILTRSEESLRMLHIHANRTIVEALVEMWQIFETVFKKLELTNSPTLCYVFPSILTLKTFCKPITEDTAAISTLKQKIIKNIDEIWLPNLTLLHKVAFFLYPPAINMQPCDLSDIKNFCISEMQHIRSSKTAPKTEYDSLCPTTTSSVLSSNFENDSSCNSDQSNLDSSCQVSHSIETNDAFFFANLIHLSASKTIDKTESEVERYCKEIVGMSENFSLMEWWKNNQNQYPCMFELALQIHSIPASCAAAENSFSMAGNIITEKLNGLESGAVKDLQFLNSLYKNDLFERTRI